MRHTLTIRTFLTKIQIANLDHPPFFNRSDTVGLLDFPKNENRYKRTATVRCFRYLKACGHNVEEYSRRVLNSGSIG